MSESKRPSSDQDPDYDTIVTSKDQKRLKVIEKDNKEATVRKIESIIKAEFNKERQLKESELDTIDQRLFEARKMMDQLRACIVVSYYSSDDQGAGSSLKTTDRCVAIHPAVKKLLERMSKTSFPSTTTKRLVTSERVGNLKNPESSQPKVNSVDERTLNIMEADHVEGGSSRGARFKLKKRIIVGNVSKYIPVDKREEKDQSTHKWMIYVRGPKEEPRIDHFVKKVWFFLHPSYRPNDLVEVSQPPFHLTRRGWGEFPVRVQLQFHDPRNKRVDILHTLKLDKSYTGLQTLGAETLVDVLIYKQESSCSALVSSPSTGKTSETISPDEDIGGYVIPAYSENSCFESTGNVQIKQEPIDEDEVQMPLSLNSIVQSTDAETIDESMPSTSGASNPVEEESTSNVKPAEPSKTSDSRPANGLSSLVKCVDKHGNLYLIPLTMFLKLNTDTQTSDVQSVVTNAAKTTSNSSTVQKVILPTNQSSSVNSNSSSVRPKNDVSFCLSNSMKKPAVPSLGSAKKPVSLLSRVLAGQKKPAETTNSSVNVVSLPKIKNHTQITEITTTPAKLDCLIKNHVSNKENSTEVNNLSASFGISKLSLDSLGDMDQVMKQILKYYPLVDPMHNKMSHPYCSDLMETFLSWNIGKRHAAEWQRSKAVRNKLLQLCSHCTKWNENQVWSTKKIYIFCRHHGYSPMKTADREINDKGACSSTNIYSGVISTYTDVTELLDKLKKSAECLEDSPDFDNENEEVDVITVNDINEIKKSKLVSSPTKPTDPLILRLPSTAACDFVREAAEQIGCRIGLEEAVTGVMAPLGEQVLLAATESFVEDIMRTAHSEAFSRNKNQRCPPSELSVVDVIKAISRLPNCDFLTDRFMGTQIQKYHSIDYENAKL